MERFSRTAMLLGDDNIRHLATSSVAVFGIGGVGGHVVETLARSGVGSFLLVDNDIVSLSNINRQIVATESTVGKYKTDVMKERILNINTNAKVETVKSFFLPENSGEIDFSRYSYVVDAVDTVSAKIEIIIKSNVAGVPVISSMGTGNKLNPSLLRIADIYDTSVCPLARVMRHELKKRGIKNLKCVYSTEKPIKPNYGDVALDEPSDMGKMPPGSVAFVPSVAGIMIAGEIIKDLCMI